MVTSQPTITDMMVAYAMDAVDHAQKAFGRNLDYSLASVEAVEEVLAAMYEAKPKGLLGRLFKARPSPEVMWSFAKMYGGYVGEVLRRHRGGDWFVDEEIVPGQKTLGLRKGDHRIWPPAKVGKRLVNGPEDNVWHYLQVVSRDW